MNTILTDDERLALLAEIDPETKRLPSGFKQYAGAIEAAVLAKLREQEPVAAQQRFRHPQKTMPDWSIWQPCSVRSRPAWEVDSQGYEVEYRPLYAAPLPAVVQSDPLGRNAFKRYLQDCDDCLIQPDVAGAFNAGWQAAAAALAQLDALEGGE